MAKNKKKKTTEKRVVKPRAEYPVAKDAALEATPDDFNFKKFPLLKREVFKDDGFWYLHRAEGGEFKAAELRAKAEEFLKFGNVKDRLKASKLRKMQDKMEELKAELEAAGVDVEDLLS